MEFGQCFTLNSLHNLKSQQNQQKIDLNNKTTHTEKFKTILTTVASAVQATNEIEKNRFKKQKETIENGRNMDPEEALNNNLQQKIQALQNHFKSINK
jgi:hypothetical protein